MNLDQLFGKYFAFLRSGLTGRRMIAATQSDTIDDPAGEGWVITLVDATVVVLPAENLEGQTVTLPLKALQTIPVRVRRVLDTGTDAVTVYLIK